MSATIPYRLSERCFRDYEPYIAQAMQVLPSTYQVLPKIGRSQNTVEARLRDAIRSLMQYRWTSSVNMLKFESLYNDIVVRRNGDIVEIALRSAKTKEAQRVATTLEVLPEQYSLPALHALCTLVAAGIVPCVCIKGANVADIVVPPDFGDIAVAERDGNVYLM